jgi:peptide/nickel transport system permease protein
MTSRPQPAGRSYQVALVALGVVYLAAIFAGFLAPYDPSTQSRDLAFVPPTGLHWVDMSGTIHLRPFVYEDGRSYPLRFFVRGAPYRVGRFFQSERHLFGVDEPAMLLLLGSDGFGRDQLSRLLYGAQISLFAGPLGAALSVALGLVLGGLAGFFGGWVDTVVMRAAELFLAVPWFYLLFAVRMALPLRIEPQEAFLMILTIVAVVGWARPARLIRGMVLSGRTRDYVVAARALGASDLHVLRRHVLPQASGIALTQAALLAPQYILAEATLSFFGLGVGEPVPSWGNMLAVLQRYDVLSSYWWMFLPGGALLAVFLLYYLLADALHERVAALPG